MRKLLFSSGAVFLCLFLCIYYKLRGPFFRCKKVAADIRVRVGHDVTRL
jgi:hypothetical protein